MDCKKALVEAEGDFDAAIDILRKKGQKVAAKRSDRDATEGLVLAKANADNTTGAVIVLNCETDFVARNADFGAVANAILNTAVAEKPANLAALLGMTYPGSSLTIADKLTKKPVRLARRLSCLPWKPSTLAKWLLTTTQATSSLPWLASTTKPATT